MSGTKGLQRLKNPVRPEGVRPVLAGKAWSASPAGKCSLMGQGAQTVHSRGHPSADLESDQCDRAGS